MSQDVILKYLGLPLDYHPSPRDQPIEFLKKNLHILPPHLLSHFASITTPRERTAIVAIRNRRLQYLETKPPELQFERARSTWPDMWDGRGRVGSLEGEEEKTWASTDFLGGRKQQIGKLGSLLAEYEEEREVQRVRALRREKAALEDEFVPEEDSDSDEEASEAVEKEAEEDGRGLFERRIRERFIYGLLDDIDYNKVDWDEFLAVDGDQDRWFEEDD